MPVQCTCFTCGAVQLRPPSKAIGHTYCSWACKRAGGPPPSLVEIDRTTVLIPLHAFQGPLLAYAAIDPADAEWAGQWAWRLGGNGYANRGVTDDGKLTIIRLHRALLGLIPGDGLEGDHVDRDKLNCRRSNLRIVTHAGNMQNIPAIVGASAHRGVTWDVRRKKWNASVQGRHIGQFNREAEAAEAAREARARLMPFSTD